MFVLTEWILWQKNVGLLSFKFKTYSGTTDCCLILYHYIHYTSAERLDEKENLCLYDRLNCVLHPFCKSSVFYLKLNLHVGNNKSSDFTLEKPSQIFKTSYQYCIYLLAAVKTWHYFQASSFFISVLNKNPANKDVSLTHRVARLISTLCIGMFIQLAQYSSSNTRARSFFKQLLTPQTAPTVTAGSINMEHGQINTKEFICSGLSSFFTSCDGNNPHYWKPGTTYMDTSVLGPRKSCQD